MVFNVFIVTLISYGYLLVYAEGLSYNNSYIVRISPQPNVNRLDVIIHMRDLYEKVDNPQIQFINEVLLPHVNLTFVLPPDIRDEVLSYLDDNSVEYEIQDTNLKRTLEMMENINTKSKETWLKDRSEESLPNYFMSYEEIVDWIEGTVNRHSEMATTRILGKTYEQRDILAVQIQNADVSDDDTINVFINAGLDPRNWLAPAASLHLIQQILMETHLRAGIKWTIIPLSNPDGYVYTMDQDRLWSKNRQLYGECHGTDLTKNWGHLFGFQASRQEACHRLHRGPEAFSELETRALRDAILADPDLDAYVNVQGTPGAWMQPWAGKTFLKTEDYEDLMDVSISVTSAVNGESDIKVVNGTPPDLKRPASGSAIDWVKEYTKIKYTYMMCLVHAKDTTPLTFLQPPSEIVKNGQWLVAAMDAMVASMRHFRDTNEWQHVTWGGMPKGYWAQAVNYREKANEEWTNNRIEL